MPVLDAVAITRCKRSTVRKPPAAGPEALPSFAASALAARLQLARVPEAVCQVVQALNAMPLIEAAHFVRAHHHDPYS